MPSAVDVAAGSASGPGRWIPTLDGWRAVAVCLVIAGHEFGGKAALPEALRFVAAKVGPLGVQIFFAISGYLITTLLLKEADAGKIPLSAFYTRRAFRILPPAFAYLACTFALSRIGVIPFIPAGDFASCIFLYANYWPKSWYVGHFWSLSVEEHFYLFWPAVLSAAGAFRAACFATVGIVAATAWKFWIGDMRLFGANPWQRTDMVIDAFFAPCLIAIVLHKSPSWKHRLTGLAGPWTTIGLTTLLLALNLADLPMAAKKAAQGVLMAPVVISTVLRPATWLGRLLEIPALMWVGRISYSLYLWQELFAVPSYSLSTMPIRITALFAVAAASYYFIERPMIARGRVLSTKRKSVSDAESAFSSTTTAAT